MPASVTASTHHQRKSSVKTEAPPRLPGVYQILCRANGKIYVGSAVNLSHRWHQHRNRLKFGKHRNKHLQNAWNKYGEAAFEFSVLEFVESEDLLTAEQAWLERTRCTDRKIGFNIYPIAGSPGETFARVWDGFIDPDGNEVSITNLHRFCHKHGLNFTAMRSLALGQGKLRSHKGWSHKNSVRKRAYIKTWEGFIDPENQPVGPITNLAAFCRKHGLDKTHLVAVANGRICSHRGWTHQNGRAGQNVKTYPNFVNPEGQRVIIRNLQAFCREQGLCSVHMRELINGRRKSHKGWTWRIANEQSTSPE